jgi:hypothetical protein
VPVAIEADAIGGDDHEKQVIVELCGVGSFKAAGTSVGRLVGVADLGVGAAVGADVVVRVEDPTEVIGEAIGVIGCETAEAMKNAHRLAI